MRRPSMSTTLFVLAALSASCFMFELQALAAGQSALGKTSKLLNPAALTAKAPATFKVNFDTSKGVIVVEAHRDWSPFGAEIVTRIREPAR